MKSEAAESADDTEERRQIRGPSGLRPPARDKDLGYTPGRLRAEELSLRV